MVEAPVAVGQSRRERFFLIVVEKQPGLHSARPDTSVHLRTSRQGAIVSRQVLL